jgi:hypothetical protein
MKVSAVLYTLIMMFVVSGSALATSVPYGTGMADVYTFAPKDRDMNDLEHSDLYYWGIDLNNAISSLGFEPADIIGAKIVIKNVYDWEMEQNRLYINLLDSRPTNLGAFTKDGRDVWVWEDSQDAANDFLAANRPAIKIAQWSDKDGPATHNNRTFNFDAAEIETLIAYISNDNKFGIGIDPDSNLDDIGNFYNDGIKLKIYTKTKDPEPTVLSFLVNTIKVPEPGTLPLLLTSALAGLAFIGRRKI